MFPLLGKYILKTSVSTNEKNCFHYRENSFSGAFISGKYISVTVKSGLRRHKYMFPQPGILFLLL